MAVLAFDPSGAVRFDLRSGAASDSRGERLVLVPSSALEALDDKTLAGIGSELGRACGARVAAHLGGDSGVRSETLEVVISHLAGELAVAGVGSVHIERWGRAMIAVVSNSSISHDAFVSAVLASALGAAAGREVAAAPLGREGDASRYFLGSPKTVEHVTTLVTAGKPYAEILVNIQGGAS